MLRFRTLMILFTVLLSIGGLVLLAVFLPWRNSTPPVPVPPPVAKQAVPPAIPAAPVPPRPQVSYLWPHRSGEPLMARFQAPAGFTRVQLPPDSFGAWLRYLPLAPRRSPVLLFNRQPRPSQHGVAAVFDIDVGNKDLQQCADAVIRLRAEFLLSRNRTKDIAFHFSDGFLCDWGSWWAGQRPQVSQAKTRWQRSARPDGSYTNFRQYLDQVFTYAGTRSLPQDSQVRPPAQIQPGDFFLQPGSPGHAVIVMDCAKDANGRIALLLAQSYTPAQSLHLLQSPTGALGAWFLFNPAAQLLFTPNWEFKPTDLRAFPP